MNMVSAVALVNYFQITNTPQKDKRLIISILQNDSV